MCYSEFTLAQQVRNHSWPVRQKICARGAPPGGGRGGGSRVKDMAHPGFGNLGAKFSETSFPHFKTCFTQIGHCHLKTIISNV